MNSPPILYIGVAAPLVEVARVWLVEVPECGDTEERRAKRSAFPDKKIGAYDLSFPEPWVLAFRTGIRVNEERVRAEVEKWGGKPPELLPKPLFEPVKLLDHRKALAELKEHLKGQPVHIVSRVGLTIQRLQGDLSEFCPDLVLLNCHGTKREGCLLFEDGWARADFVPGERLF